MNKTYAMSQRARTDNLIICYRTKQIDVSFCEAMSGLGQKMKNCLPRFFAL